MRITVLAVGRLKEPFWRDAADEYLKRLKAYADVRVVEIPDRDPTRLGELKAMAQEGADIIGALPDGAHVIALAIDGRALSSTGLAEEMERLALHGSSHVAFIVGGSHGLSSEVLSRADARLSLGAMTLPHNLARIVLLEQVYRAFRINRGEPYHK